MFITISKKSIINSSSSSEFIYIEKSRINYSSVELVSKGFFGERSSSNILSFKDMESFKRILSELEEEKNNLDNAFITYYKDLDEAAINTKDEEVGFDEEAPFYAFEKATGFYSLFHQIEDKMKKFLEEENPDWNNSPNDHFIADKALRVLLNRDAEVMIGNSIYKFYEDGSYCEIHNRNLNTLQSISGREISNLIDNPNVTVYGIENSLDRSDDCKSGKSDRGEKANGNYKIKWKIKFYNYPWEAGMKSFVDSYKWHGGWLRKWKSHRTYIKVGVEGRFCQGNQTINNGLTNSTGWVYCDRYNKSSWDCKIHTTIYSSTKSGQVHGYHYASGVEHNSTLTF